MAVNPEGTQSSAATNRGTPITQQGPRWRALLTNSVARSRRGYGLFETAASTGVSMVTVTVRQ